MDDLARVVDASEARSTLLNRHFKEWSVTEQRESFELSGWLHSGVRVSVSGLKSEVPRVLRAFFDGLEALERG